MRLLAFLALWSVAMLAPWAASADDQGSRSGWVRIETDKGCVAYLSGTPGFYTTKAYRWSEPCAAGQPISGTGRLAMYMDGKVWVRTGRLVTGYFEDFVTEEKFVVVNGKWDDRTPVRTSKDFAKGGCFYPGETRDPYKILDWEGCVPRGGARAVRAPRLVFAAVSVNAPASPPVPTPPSTRAPSAGIVPLPGTTASTGNPNYPVGGPATPYPAGAPGALMRSCQKELQRTGNALSTPQEWPALWRENFVSYAERIADMESADVVRSEFKRLITNRNRYSMGTAFVCMMDVRARQLGGTVADLIAAVAPPPMKSVPVPAAPPGTGSYVVDSRSAPGGVSVSGPDQTGVSTVKSPPITGSASASTGSPVTGGRDRTIPSANYCISMTNSIQRPASAPAMRVHVYRNNCSFELAVFGMREGPAVYHLLWAMKPGESVWDPYATLDDGKPYNKLLSYIACRNDRNYGADSDYDRKTVTCKGP